MNARNALKMPGSGERLARLGFAGVGWIGANRMQAVAANRAASIACVADPSAEAANKAVAALLSSSGPSPGSSPGSVRGPHAQPPVVVSTFEALLEQDLDAVVIATPSGLHAGQAMAALSRGLPVFCQKPLARTAAEAAQVVEVARSHDRLLEVDFCYRTLAGIPELVTLVRGGAIGEPYAVDLMFHNAYGPGKPWFYDREQSGGGCVMDLGIHLVDLLLWALDYPHITGAVTDLSSRLHANGKRVSKPADVLEDHATAELSFQSGLTARLACSWRLSAGRDAVIEAAFYGTKGAVILRNVNGSFYDFTVEHCEGTQRRVLAGPPDDWGGRAICQWAAQIGADPRFDRRAGQLVIVSSLIDRIYGR